jgi:hypothetical protein
VGSATSPSFELATTNFANLSTQLPNLYSNHLTFGDLDNDGDQDLMVGSYNGNLFYLENSAPAGTLCNFTIKQSNYLDANSKIIDVGNQATPQLIDADRDGDLDLIIGSLQGRISFYRNTGTPSLPLFTLVTDSFGKATLQKGNSVPFLYDDGTGYQLLVGSKSAKNSYLPSGWIWHYNNIDGNLNGKFTLVDSCLQKIWEGEQMTVNGKDINQDGKMDLIIGNKCGGIVIYYGDSTPLGLPTFSQTGFDFTIYPNPASNQIRLVVADFKTPLHYTVSLINAMGEVVGSYNLSEASTLLTLHLARGIYSCVLSCNGIQSAKKLIILE